MPRLFYLHQRIGTSPEGGCLENPDYIVPCIQVGGTAEGHVEKCRKEFTLFDHYGLRVLKRKGDRWD